MENEYIVGAARHKALCRWWIKSRPVKSANGSAAAELYVPFWALPLELLHRAVFGKATI